MIVRVRRVPLLAGALLSMAYGVWLGLLRLGWILPLPWPDQLILHGPLMIGGFLGTLIGLERAIGVGKRWAFAAPICSAAGVIVLVFFPPGPIGPVLISAASAFVVVVFLNVLRRQPSMFVGTMLAGAICWFIGNVVWGAGAAIYVVVFWWIGFVVLTIAGERLELNRVLRPSPLVRSAFLASAAILLGGVIAQALAPAGRAVLSGVGLMAVAAWLGRNDVARRTIRHPGVTGYMASCLLAGYAWLVAAGVLLMTTGATSPGPKYDAVVHAVFVGFVVSMIFGHAPILFPAVLGVPLQYRQTFYLHLVVLHLSVSLRVTGDLVDELGRLRAWGGLLNAAAILIFVVATVGSFRPRART